MLLLTLILTLILVLSLVLVICVGVCCVDIDLLLQRTAHYIGFGEDLPEDSTESSPGVASKASELTSAATDSQEDQESEPIHSTLPVADEAFRVIAKWMGQEVAEAICCGNPARLFEGNSIEATPRRQSLLNVFSRAA